MTIAGTLDVLTKVLIDNGLKLNVKKSQRSSVAALRCGKAVQIHCSFVVCTASCTACILEKDKKTNKTMPINNTGLCYCQHADVTISVRKNAENARFQIRDFKVDFLKVFKEVLGGHSPRTATGDHGSRRKPKILHSE